MQNLDRKDISAYLEVKFKNYFTLISIISVRLLIYHRRGCLLVDNNTLASQFPQAVFINHQESLSFNYVKYNL